MIVHELATNAIKYGALSKPGGHLTAGWELSAARAGADLIFTWEEHGGPPVAPPQRKGFGRTVLEDAARHVGSAKIVYASEGLRYELTAPLASIGWSLAPQGG